MYLFQKIILNALIFVFTICLSMPKTSNMGGKKNKQTNIVRER